MIGAGGIGFDVSEYLTHAGAHGVPQEVAEWRREWGVGDPEQTRGGLVAAQPIPSPRQIYLLQRKTSKAGAGLGKTSGWVHRAALKGRGVETITGVTYELIDDAGVHITVGARGRVLEVDDVVVCAGQESRREVLDELRAAGVRAHVIGGADVAAELDAKRAIDQGTRLAATL